MYKCEHCGATFQIPNIHHIWSRYEINEDDVLICPSCGDDRIHMMWEKSHENKTKGEETKSNE
jgi:DNA-directed RNA polymerase subunit RPC12/RpoP